MPTQRVERRIPWPRDRRWRPGEPINLTVDGVTTTYGLRGVQRDTDPASAFATVILEPVRSFPADATADEALPAAG